MPFHVLSLCFWVEVVDPSIVSSCSVKWEVIALSSIVKAAVMTYLCVFLCSSISKQETQ